MTEKTAPKGLGGWLVIPIISIILSFFSLLFYILSSFNSVVLSGAWEQLIEPSSMNYMAHFVWIYPIELIGNILFFIVNCYIAYLLFTKNYKFPHLFIYIELSYIAFLVLDLILCTSILKLELDKDDIKGLVRALIYAAIWVPYMLNSVRVKNTFVNGRRDELTY